MARLFFVYHKKLNIINKKRYRKKKIMIFKETTENKNIYSTYLYEAYKNQNRNLILKQKTNKKMLIINIVYLLASVSMGYNLFNIILLNTLSTKNSAYQISKRSEIALIYTISLVLGIIVISIVGAIKKIIIKKLQPKKTEHNFNNEVANFADPHLLNSNCIRLTYLSPKDRDKHKTEINKIARDNPHKKVVVYILSHRIPYIVRFDSYVFCFAVQDGKMQLLGIADDNKDHTMPAILAQTHKLGPLMPDEKIEKNYEILN